MFQDLLSQPKSFFSVRKRWSHKVFYKFIVLLSISFLVCSKFYARSSNCPDKNKIFAYAHISSRKERLEKVQKLLEKLIIAKHTQTIYNLFSASRNTFLLKLFSEFDNTSQTEIVFNGYAKTNDNPVILTEKPKISKAEKDNKNAFIAGFLASLVIVLFIFSGFFIYRQKNKALSIIKIFNLKKEASQIDNITAPPKKKDENDRVTKSTYRISEEMTNFILKKLGKFEDSGKFLRKDINLTWLSNHFNTNSKYISEVIKVHRSKSFNSYINGLRIQYITSKLIDDPVYREYKISYLSEECGYSSTQVFVIAFKKETGVTPSHFIERLKKQL